MVHGLWGKKIGMTQMFSEKNTVVPVTVIDISDWYVTQIKTQEKDGYDALQLGQVKKKYASEPFSPDWLKKPRTYFSAFNEVPYTPSEIQPPEGEPSKDEPSKDEPSKDGDTPQGVTVGQSADALVGLAQGDFVDVFGITKGHGFQGVVKRHGYSGGPASHGSTFGRLPGALSFMTAVGRVIKGKKMPGHMGVNRRAMKNLEVITVEPETRIVAVKGSIPGKAGSLVFVRKCR